MSIKQMMEVLSLTFKFFEFFVRVVFGFLADASCHV
jgi:hypothetical protein